MRSLDDVIVSKARLWWNWELDEDHYPDWEGLAHNLSATNTKLLTYINPYVANTVTKNKPNFKRDLFKEGAAAGFLVKDKTGAPYVLASGSTSFTFGTVDLSNPAAAAWYSAIIQENMLDRNQSGWMADFGEYLPFDSDLFQGTAAVEHNKYPEEWAAVNRRSTDNRSAAEAVFFMRSSHTRSPKYATMFWAGDQLVTYDEVRPVRNQQ